MASNLPLWYARERGTDLIGFADLGDGGDGGDDGEPEGNRAGASVLGTFVIGMLLGLGVAVIAAVGAPIALTVLAGIASAAIVAWCFVAIALSIEADPSTAALMTVAITAGIGEAAELIVIILAFALGIIFILSLIGALSSDRR